MGDLFGAIFDDEDEDVSLTSFSTAKGTKINRITKPTYFETRPKTNFVGLLNQGATCYMNSLIQAMYMTPELRQGLYSLTPDELEVPLTPEEIQREIEAEKKAAKEKKEKEEKEKKEKEEKEEQKEKEKKEKEEQKEKSSIEKEKTNDTTTSTTNEVHNILSAMGYEDSIIDKALLKFPHPGQKERAIEWIVSGKAASSSSSKVVSGLDGDISDDDNDTTKEYNILKSDRNIVNGDDNNNNDDDDIYDLFGDASDAFGPMTIEDDENNDNNNDDDDDDDDAIEQALHDAKIEAMKKKALEKATIGQHAKLQFANTNINNNTINTKTTSTNSKEQQEEQIEWACEACTFINVPTHSRCQVCDTKKPCNPIPSSSLLTSTNNENISSSSSSSSSSTSTLNDNENQENKNENNNNHNDNNNNNDDDDNLLLSQVRRTKKRKIPIELQRLFARLQLANQEAASTEALTDSYGWAGNEAFQQHDVHELNKVLYDAIERSLKNTSQQNLINDLYKGITVNQIICCSCKNASAREEPFQDLTLTVVGNNSVQESLDNFTAFELLTGDNQYQCSACNSRVDALKGAAFCSLPPILIMSLLRFTYDWETDTRSKHTDKFAFPLVLDMNPYTKESIEKTRIATYFAPPSTPSPSPSSSSSSSSLDSTISINDNNNNDNSSSQQKKNFVRKGMQERRPPTKLTRKQKRELRAKEKQEKEELNDNNDNNNNDDDDSIFSILDDDDDDDQRKNHKKTKKENVVLLEQSEIDPLSPYLYNLFAVIIHTGSQAGYGHYHAYIRDVIGQGTVVSPSSTTKDIQNNNNNKDEDEDENDDDENKKKDVPLLPKQKEIENISNSLWLDFNDSSVEPISFTKLASQYSGKGECAYMLIYRKNSLDQSAISNKTMVPPHLSAEIEELNVELDHSRVKYMEDLSKVDVMVYNTLHFKIDKGVIYKIDSANLDEETKLRAKKILSLDSKQTTVAQLKDQICEIFPDNRIPEKIDIKINEIRLRGSRVVIARELDDDTKTLEELEISGGGTVSVLAWDGQHIGNDIWNEEADTILIHVIKYSPPSSLSSSATTSKDDDSSNNILVVEGENNNNNNNNNYIQPTSDIIPDIEEFDVRIGDRCSLWDLKTKLTQISGIPENLQYICKPGYKELIQLQENNINIFELGLYNQSKITLEAIPSIETRTTNYSSWAWYAYLAKQQLMEIFVTDLCSGIDPPPLLAVEVGRTITVEQLKYAIVEKLPSGIITPDNVILRKALPGNSAGPILADESLPLKSAGIDDGQRVIAEVGDASRVGAIVNLKFVGAFTAGMKEKTLEDPIDISLPRSSTIFECKQKMLELFQKSPHNYRMYTTDMWGKPDRLFDDEQQTLEQAKILDDTLLYIEEGKPPVKGQITVEFQLYFLMALAPPLNNEQQSSSSSSLSSSSISSLSDVNETITTQQQQEKPTKLLHTTTTENKIKEQEEEEEVTSSLSSSVLLYDNVVSPAIHLSPKTWIAKLSSTTDNEDFVVSPLCILDILRSTKLQQVKELLLEQPILDHVKSTQCLRIWKDGILLKHNSWSLKKLHVSNQSTLTVEVLPPNTLQHDNNITAVEEGILIYVQERDSNHRAFKGPREMWFMGDTVEELKAAVSQLTDIPEGFLEMAKYIHYNGKWRRIPSEDEQQKEQEQQQQQQQQKEQQDKDKEIKEKETSNSVKEDATSNNSILGLKRKSIQMKPYCLKDGDVIVAKDIRTDPMNEDDFTQALLGKSKAPRRPPSNKKKAPRTKEVALKIHVEEF